MVNHYCKQLGITLYNPALPLAWADRDTGELLVAEDETAPEAAVPDSPSPGAVPLDRTESRENREKEKTTWLGFAPPREDGIPSGLRPRKSRRKDAMGAFGVDG